MDAGLDGRQIAIAGAGIAGLAAGQVLAARGAQVSIHEQAAAVREFGGGLQVSPNGMAVLRAMGLEAEAVAAGCRASALELCDGATGRRVLAMALDRPDRPYLFLHRQRLIVLLDAAARAAGVEIRTDQRIDTPEARPVGDHATPGHGAPGGPALRHDGQASSLRAPRGHGPDRELGRVVDGVAPLRTSAGQARVNPAEPGAAAGQGPSALDASARPLDPPFDLPLTLVPRQDGGRIRLGEELFDLLIGADGVHSRLRPAVEGPGAAVFTGQVAWRAVIPAEPGIPPVVTVAMGPGRHLVSYPLGGGLRNIVAVEERQAWAADRWNQTDDPQNLRAAFAGFAPRFRRWLDAVDEVHLWGLIRHPVAARWHRGGVAILGDAAHPTLPFLAQGANMALEDAWLLGARLAREPQDAALAGWQAARLPRVCRIIAAANANARNYHLRGPLRAAAHLTLRIGGRLAPSAPAARFDWLYGHDVTRA